MEKSQLIDPPPSNKQLSAFSVSGKNIPDPSLLPNRIMDVMPRLSRTLIIHEANSHSLVRSPVIPSREEWFPQALEKGHFSLANDLLTANGLTRMDNSPQKVDTGASYRQSKREMKWMVGAWVVFFVWVNGYGWLNAYLPEDEYDRICCRSKSRFQTHMPSGYHEGEKSCHVQ